MPLGHTARLAPTPALTPILTLFLILLLASPFVSCRENTPPRQSENEPNQAQRAPMVDPAPYEILRRAYAERDADLAASAYSPDAALEYQNTPVAADETYRGRDQIRQSFQTFFDGVNPSRRLDLNFRVASQTPESGEDGHLIETGVYRLRVSDSVTTFGHFEVERTERESFARDTSRPATRADFENLAGPVLLDAEDDELDGATYDGLAGRYQLSTDCDLVVTRSVVRLMVRNSCTQQWRGLQRITGRHWRAGDHVLSDQVEVHYRFGDPGQEGRTPAVETAPAAQSGNDGQSVRNARAQLERHPRRDRYSVTSVNFPSRPTGPAAPTGPGDDLVVLAGDLLLPADGSADTGEERRRPATVLVHGSGPQDRHGYASIMSVLADALAARGQVVLSYDKRGVGGSSGDWSTASFGVLGGDAKAAMEYLATRSDVDPTRISLAGSSQAGWVIAKAIEDGARPAGVFLLGAAGSALTVEEQNIYNTRIRMGCAGYTGSEIATALDQQQAFFDFVAQGTSGDSGAASRLNALTREARREPRLEDWLFPSSSEVDLSSSNWFTALELRFDPLDVWARSTALLDFVFAEYDDSTPTSVATSRLGPIAEATGGRLRVKVLEGAQHLGLEAKDACSAELSQVSGFHPGLFAALDAFVQRLESSSR